MKITNKLLEQDLTAREEWQLMYKLTPEQESQGFRIGGISVPTLFDKNFNGWNLEMISIEEAIEASKLLVNCEKCFGCENCHNCHGCSWCKNCKNCTGCFDCENCTDCEDCFDCNNLTHISDYLNNEPNRNEGH